MGFDSSNLNLDYRLATYALQRKAKGIMIWFFIGGEVGKKQLMTDYHLSEKEARQCALSRFYGFMTLISTVYAITQITDAGSFLVAVIIGGICGLLYWNADRIKKKGLARRAKDD